MYSRDRIRGKQLKDIRHLSKDKKWFHFGFQVINLEKVLEIEITEDSGVSTVHFYFENSNKPPLSIDLGNYAKEFLIQLTE